MHMALYMRTTQNNVQLPYISACQPGIKSKKKRKTYVQLKLLTPAAPDVQSCEEDRESLGRRFLQESSVLQDGHSSLQVSYITEAVDEEFKVELPLKREVLLSPSSLIIMKFFFIFQGVGTYFCQVPTPTFALLVLACITEISPLQPYGTSPCPRKL